MQNMVKESSDCTKRIVSIDALRGFTMLFIIGGGEFLSSFYEVWPNFLTKTLAENMEHAGWEGFYFLDLIFPLFLFLVGLLLPFVILGRLEGGAKPGELCGHIIKAYSGPCFSGTCKLRPIAL